MISADQAITEQGGPQDPMGKALQDPPPLTQSARQLVNSLGAAKLASLVAILGCLSSAAMGPESTDPLTIIPRLNPDLGKLEMSWPNRTNTVFQIQKQGASAGGTWNGLTYITGDAPTLTFVDEHAKDSSQLYRLEVTEDPPSITTNLQRTLDTQKRITGTKGACAAVITSNLTWIGTSGMSDPTNGVPLEPNMRFGMASLTKMLMAAHLLQLQEEGKLSLDDPLSKWLPDFNNVTNIITFRQCLNHTAGLHDWYNDSTVFPNAFTNDWNKFWTPEDTLALIKRHAG